MTQSTNSEHIDWERVHTTIDEETWANRLLEQTKEDVSNWIDTYQDESTRIAGWYHDYNCEACSARLTLDLQKPNMHVCPDCGKINTGEKLDLVWNNAYRGRANAMVYNAAVLHRIAPDKKYVAYIRKVLDFYRDEYDNFLPSPPAKRFEGKIMNQHLDDAVGMMQILLGIDLIRIEFSTDELDGYYDDLFSKEASLFDFFATRIYNIPVWIKCAQAMIGIFFDKPEQIQSAFYEKYGILDQLERGVTEDGLWYEGSMHYHFYALQPICYVLFMCRCRGFELPELPAIYTTVEKMLTYPIHMIFRDRRFPNPNDAHPELHIDRYYQQYEYASLLFDNPLFREVCGTFYDDESEGTLTRLLFNAWPKVDNLPDFGTVNNASSYTAMLKTDHTELFIKYGQHTFLHMHPDVMNIEIAFDGDRVVYDLGNGGYASFLFAEWQRMTVAHNTVCLNMKSRRRFPSIPDGIVRDFDPDRNSLTVSAKGVYEASNFTRTVTVADYRVEDTFTVDARGEYTFDWMFYCKGDVICPYETVPVESLGDDEGYQHLFDIRKFSTDGDWYVEFDLEDKTIRTTMAGEAGTEVFLVNSYTHSTEKKRYGLAVRRHTENTQFRAVHECVRITSTLPQQARGIRSSAE